MENTLKSCSCHQNTKHIDDYPSLKEILPLDYNYLISEYDDEEFIKIKFHINCSTKDDIFKWLEKLSSSTNLTFTIEETGNESIHQIRSKCQCLEETCETVLELTLQSNISNSSNQSALCEYPTSVIFHCTHKLLSDNSSDTSEFAVEYIIDDVDVKTEVSEDSLPFDFAYDNFSSTETASIAIPNETVTRGNLEQFFRKKLYYLFEKDYSPQQAYNLYKKEIHRTFEKENPDDKNERPCLKWVYDQYYAFFEERHGLKIQSDDAKVYKIKKNLTTAHSNRANKKINTSISTKITKPGDPLGEKINELCKKYVPILPASGVKKFNNPNISIVSFTSGNANIQKTSHRNLPSNSYIIKFNSEKKNDKLNLYPLKLIANVNNEHVQSFKLPELKIIPNTKNRSHILEVVGANNAQSQNIPIPSGVDGIIILTIDKPNVKENVIQPTIVQNFTARQPPLRTNFVISQTISTPQCQTESKKQKRKSVLKYEDADEIVFTDNIDDLKEKSQPHQRKARKPVHPIAAKRQKVYLPCPLDGIENVICPD